MDKRPIDRAIEWAAQPPRNWTKAELARRLEISDQVLYNWRGRGMPPEWHYAVAKLLGHTVEELVTGSTTIPGAAAIATNDTGTTYDAAPAEGPLTLTARLTTTEARVIDALRALPEPARASFLEALDQAVQGHAESAALIVGKLLNDLAHAARLEKEEHDAPNPRTNRKGRRTPRHSEGDAKRK